MITKTEKSKQNHDRALRSSFVEIDIIENVKQGREVAIIIKRKDSSDENKRRIISGFASKVTVQNETHHKKIKTIQTKKETKEKVANFLLPISILSLNWFRGVKCLAFA